MPQKVRSILNSWKNRGLSLLGKVQVVNSLVASLFVYKNDGTTNNAKEHFKKH